MSSHSPEAVEQRAYLSAVTELVPFEDGTGEGRYRARTADERQFVIPELIADTLRLLDGERSVEDIARLLSAQTGRSFAADDVQALIDHKLLPTGMVQSGAAPAIPNGTRKSVHIQSSLARLEFILRVPLLSGETLAPITGRLAGLFKRSAVIVCVLLFVAAHVAFYLEPGSARHISYSPRDLCLAYLLVFASMLIHELGHASASRRFGCEHGDIGFTLYLMFPGLYADMSRAWRLTGWQRAVIDVGGIYFQLAVAVPLWLLHRFTAQPCFATAIYAIDLMAVFALNPFLKFDGYWLVVDLSGLVNLQQRAFHVLRESVAWVVHRQVPPTLKQISGKARRCVLLAYSAAMLLGIAVGLPYLLRRVPLEIVRFGNTLSRLSAALQSSPEAAVLETGKLIGSLFVFLFLYRIVVRLTRPFYARSQVAAGKPKGASSPAWPFWRVVLNSALLLFIVDFCIIAIHEFSHGLTAMVLGGQFPFVQLYAAAGRSVFIFPYGAPFWKNPVVLLAGYFSHFALQLVLLAVLRSVRGGKWSCLASSTGAMAGVSVIVGAGLLPGSAGEAGAALQLLHLPAFVPIILKTSWLACELLLIAIFLSRLFTFAGPIQPHDSYSMRMRAVLAAWGIPLLLLAIPSAFPVSASSATLIAGLLAAGALFSMLPFLISSPAYGVESDFFLQRGLGKNASLAAVLFMLQFIFFGYSLDNPRGLFLSKHPSEVTVAACNVRIRVDKDRKAQVTMLMRPFVWQHSFLWERVRLSPPDQWNYYKAFFNDNLPRLLPCKKSNVITTFFDPLVPFYIDGHWSRGARVIEAEVELPSRDRPAAGPDSIVMSDFWKRQRLGNLDLFEVTLSEGLTLVNVVAKPRGAPIPRIDSSQTIRWLTPKYEDAFESVRFTVAGLQ